MLTLTKQQQKNEINDAGIFIKKMGWKHFLSFMVTPGIRKPRKIWGMCERVQARSHGGGIRGQWPPDSFVPPKWCFVQKIFLKRITKTKILCL